MPLPYHVRIADIKSTCFHLGILLGKQMLFKYLLKKHYSVADGLFKCFSAVLVNLGLVLLTVAETACTVDTAANASHTLDEVAVENALVELKKCHTASLDAVTNYGLNLEVDVLLLKSLSSSLGKTAYTCEDTTEVGCVIKHALLKGCNIEVSGIKECLELLEGKNAVNVGLNLFKLSLCLLRGARTDEDNLGVGSGLLDVLSKRAHRRHIVRDMLYYAGEVGLDVLNECGAAGAGKKPLLGELLSLLKSNHICTESSLDYVVEAELLKAGDDLSELSVGELAGDRGSNNGVNLVVSSSGVSLTLLENVDAVNDVRLINNCTEGALVYTSAALNTLGVVDLSRLILVHGDSLYLTSVLARTLTVYDSGEGTNLRARAALLTLGFVNVSNVVGIERDSTELTNVLATVCKTAAASVGNLVSAYGTLITCELNNLDNVGVVLIAAHSNLYSLGNDSTLLVNTATGGCLLTGNDGLRHVEEVLNKLVIPSKPCNLTKHLVFQMLYFSVKFAHFCLLN